MNKEFGYKEVLLKVTKEKDADFTNSSSTDDSKKIVEAEVVAVGHETNGFYKEGDKVLVPDNILKRPNHKHFKDDEYLIEFERQIICRIA